MIKLDSINSDTCPRCGGSGRHSFNWTDGDTCWGCNGTGLVLVTPKGQPKIEPTAKWESAGVGDIAEYNQSLYIIDAVAWKDYGIYSAYNQRVTVRRLVDGKVSNYKRCAYELNGSFATQTLPGGVVESIPGRSNIRVSAAMNGQPATLDERGEWVTF